MGLKIQNFCASTPLALGAVLLAVSCLVLVLSGFLPYWFIIRISPNDAAYGVEGKPESYSISSGLFFMSSGENSYQDMVFLNKITNHQFAPKAIVAGQVFYIAGVTGLLGCTVAAFILACRELGSVVGEFFLAGFVTISSICVVLGVIFSSFVFLNPNDNEWINLPMHSPFRVSSKISPEAIDIDWVYYVAIIGAVTTIVGVVFIWIEALKTCRYVEDIRKKQLMDPSYGRTEDIPYTQFTYEQSYPKSYQVTVPSAQPQRPVYYGQEIESVSGFQEGNVSGFQEVNI